MGEDSLWHVRGSGRADIDAFFVPSPSLQPSRSPSGTSSYLFPKNVKFNCLAYFVLRISSMVASPRPSSAPPVTGADLEPASHHATSFCRKSAEDCSSSHFRQLRVRGG